MDNNCRIATTDRLPRRFGQCCADQANNHMATVGGEWFLFAVGIDFSLVNWYWLSGIVRWLYRNCNRAGVDWCRGLFCRDSAPGTDRFVGGCDLFIRSAGGQHLVS